MGLLDGDLLKKTKKNDEETETNRILAKQQTRNCRPKKGGFKSCKNKCFCETFGGPVGMNGSLGVFDLECLMVFGAPGTGSFQ